MFFPRAKKAVNMNNSSNGSGKFARSAALIIPVFVVLALASCGEVPAVEQTTAYTVPFYETAAVTERDLETTLFLATTPEISFGSSSETEISETTVLQTGGETTTAAHVETTRLAETTAVPEPDEYTLENSFSDVIPHGYAYTYSDEMYEGESIVLKPGVDGKKITTVYTTYINGSIAYMTSEKKTSVYPIDEEVMIGTAPVYSEKSEKESSVIDYSTKYVYDDGMYEDEEKRLTAGVPGTKETVWTVTFEYGIEVSREIDYVDITPPVDEIIKKGTKPVINTETVVKTENFTTVPTEYVYDDTIYEGERAVARNGSDGFDTNTYRITYKKGVKLSEELVSSVRTNAVSTIIKIGTKKKAEEMRMPFRTAAEGGADYYVSQYFGGTNDHGGIDFGVYYGSPILAVMSGTVIYAYDDGYFSKSNILWTYGTYVVIEHDNGLRTYYAHLSGRTVSAGDRVSQGQVIGFSGNTGRVSPAPTSANPYAGTHLHFEVRALCFGTYKKVDPRGYLPRWK